MSNKIEKGFHQHSGTALPLDEANVDTDQIIPKQFLTAVTRSGFGQHLFHDWRYLDDKEQVPNPDFVLNKAEFQGASILLSRENFGCGSSREHAPWALKDFGFRVIIAASFADIFYGNCLNNQLLPIVLPPDALDHVFAAVNTDPVVTLIIDLPEQQVHCGEQRFHFNIDAKHKHNLLNGLDDIGLTLTFADAIQAYEQQIPAWRA